MGGLNTLTLGANAGSPKPREWYGDGAAIVAKDLG
jgi:hypothetical protein